VKNTIIANISAAGLKGKVVLSLGLSLLITLLMQYFSLQLNKSLEEAKSWVTHTHQVIGELEQAHSSLTILESNVRGYVISNNRDFLHGLQADKAGVYRHLDNIRRLTVDNPAQQQHITQLLLLVEAKIAFNERILGNKGSEAAALIASGQGKTLMDRIRLKTSVMRQIEHTLLAKREEKNRQLSAQVKTINLLSILFILGAGLIALVFIFSDIDKKVKLEQELRDNESRLKQFFEALPIGITVRDAAGELYYANREGQEILGKLFPQGAIRKLRQLVDDHKVFVAGTDACYPMERMPIVRALSGMSTEVDDMEVRHGQERIFLSETACPVYNSEGQIVYALAAFRDITERKKAETELMMAKEAAEASSVAKERFLANMSHEVLTPLNAILGFTDLLLASELQEEQRQFADAIHVSGENLHLIINNVLDFSKLEKGLLQLERKPFSLAAQLDALQVLFRQKARKKGLAFSVNGQEHLPALVLGDPLRLSQMLFHLVDNALKFTRQGTVDVEAAVLKQDQDTVWLRLAVRDSGIGIPEDKRTSIFERFSQASDATTRVFGGSGLGLSLVKSLAELQGGRIELESAPGKGAEFVITLPYGLLKDRNLPERSPEPATEKQAGGRPLHVLVTEDNPINQKLALRVLADMGLTTELAVNGQEAVALIGQQKHFDIVLMDIQMPVMDGYEATRLIRRELGSSVPILAMTAHSMSTEKEKCLALGMDGYITKPFKAKELFAHISMLAGAGQADAAVANVVINTAPAAAAVCDLAYLRLMAGGDQAFEREMIGIFLRQVPAELELMQQALLRQDLVQVKEVAHKLKSSVSLLGVERMLTCLKEIETLAQVSQEAETDRLLHLHQELTKVNGRAAAELQPLMS